VTKSVSRELVERLVSILCQYH